MQMVPLQLKSRATEVYPGIGGSAEAPVRVHVQGPRATEVGDFAHTEGLRGQRELSGHITPLLVKEKRTGAPVRHIRSVRAC